MRVPLLVVVAVLGLGLAGCAAPSPAPVASSTSTPESSPDETGDDLTAACTTYPEAYLDLQTVAINADSFAEVTAQSAVARGALDTATETTLGGSEYETFVAEQRAFFDLVDASALAEDRIALLTAVQEGPSFIEPLTELCAGRPGW